MTDRYELSRRKVLAGLGTIGLAGAGAGLGTTAYFSDEETFKNNTLTAGALDLKVDWQEHYSDWSPDEGDGLDNDIIMAGQDDGIPANYVGLPDPADPLIYVHEDDLAQFMMNTAVEAFPDPDNDGIQEFETNDFTYVPCEDGADTPEDLTPRPNGRTDNFDTVGTVDGNEETYPLVYLEDVKPGDFGELTFSFHLCDNPGYVWMNGDLVSASENGVTEPEMKDPDEDYPEGDTVELLDTVQTALWYDDDGDNLIRDEGALDVMVVLDDSGSINSTEAETLRNAANDLVDGILAAGDNQVGGIKFGANAVTVERVLGDTSFDFTNGAGSGNTPMPPALDAADRHLDDAGRAEAEQVVVLLTDGGPNYENQVYSITDVGDAPRANNWSADDADQAYDNGGQGGVSSGELDETELVADNIKSPSGDDTGAPSRIVTVGIGDPENVAGTTLDEFLRDRVASSTDDHYNANFDNINDIINDVVAGVVGEEVIFRGTLRELLTVLSTDNGIPLDGNLSTPYDELVEGTPAPGDDPARECFEAVTDGGELATHYVSLAWWLPVDHGNEVQTDSAMFDLGFYTEQCRHNSGAGMADLVPTRSGSGFVDAAENFNGDGTSVGAARARYGNNGPTGAWELAVGDRPGTSGEFAQENYEWTSGATVPWTLTWNGTDLIFEFDDVPGFSYTLDEVPDGRIGLQAKANEATVSATVDELAIDGQLRELSGENSVTASNDGDGRAIEYLVLNTGLTGEQNFTISGTATVSLQQDYGGSDEGVAFDIVLE